MSASTTEAWVNVYQGPADSIYFGFAHTHKKSADRATFSKDWRGARLLYRIHIRPKRKDIA